MQHVWLCYIVGHDISFLYIFSAKNLPRYYDLQSLSDPWRTKEDICLNVNAWSENLWFMICFPVCRLEMIITTAGMSKT